MEQVASMLERRISSLNSGAVQSSEDRNAEGPSQRLLKSASLDSMMGLRSPGTATPELREEWQPPQIIADLSIEPGIHDEIAHMASSPFQQPAQEPLEETLIIGPSKIYHGLTRPSQPRHDLHEEADGKPDPTARWKEQRTLLIFWLVASLVTLVSSLRWLQVGMWAGLIGVIGPSIATCGCLSQRRLHLNLHVTRIFAVACSALSVFAAVLFTFLLIRLHCPASVRASDYCSVFRLGMALSGLWYCFYAIVAALVSARISKILAMIEPTGLRRIVVLRAAGPVANMPRLRSSDDNLVQHNMQPR